ncbi:MAG: integral rane sensor signal transduction histidine kinase [Solirubrobacterales bacterium]|nr:integral rane sensor signal transduction histidine kinase [Solirubrobacterales bacterium]
MRSGLRRLAPAGLRWRLAGWFTLVTLLCIAIVFVAVYRGTGSQLRRQIDHELSGDAAELAHNLTGTDAEDPREHSARELHSAATRYIDNQPFSASSTLLFVLIPGAAPSTNRPELFGNPAPEVGETFAEQAEENRLAQRLHGGSAGYSTLMLPDVGEVRVLKLRVRVRPGLSVIVGAGEPLATVSRAQGGVARAFVLAGLIALAVALLASYFVGARVSRPLRRMAGVAARVDAGDLHPRIDAPTQPGDEVTVLAEAFNHMLDRLTEAFAGQRAFIADASHELRTPLTVIRGQLEVLASQQEPSREEVRRVEGLVQAEIARMSRLVDDLLLLAKTDQVEFLRIESIDLPVYVGELWDGMSLLASRRFELGPVPHGTLRADPDRLAQALRNLVGNAIDHTRPEDGVVRMRVRTLADGRIRFIVEDDGPGVPPEQRERVFHRFHRTDTARDRASGGTGLGLAIVRAITDAHGGSVCAGEARDGGARFELELPGFAAAPGGARPREDADASTPLSPTTAP